MLLYEYKLRLSPPTRGDRRGDPHDAVHPQQSAAPVDGWAGVSANDLQLLCARLAQEFDFAARLNSQARQAAASRAWAAIERFYTNCREKRPGEEGVSPLPTRCRSVEYKQTGWQLDAAGKRLTLTDGGGIGRVRLIGSRELATFPLEQIKRVRLLRRADGYYASSSSRWSGASAMPLRARRWGSTWASRRM
jgi:hypothetical protein